MRNVTDVAKSLVADIFNRGDMDVFDGLLAEDYVNHNMPVPGVPGTKDGFRQVVLGTRAAFPDVHVEISGLIEQDDMIAFHELATATGTGAQQHPAEPGAPVANGDPLAEIRRWRDHQALVQHRPARHDAATGCHPQ